MAIPKYLLDDLIEGTRQFIEEDAEDIAFVQYEKVKDATGGIVETPVGDPNGFTERVRLIPQSDAVPMARTTDGDVPVPVYVLLAMPGSRIKRRCRFTYKGQQLSIHAVHLDPEYEVKGDVIANG